MFTEVTKINFNFWEAKHEYYNIFMFVRKSFSCVVNFVSYQYTSILLLSRFYFLLFRFHDFETKMVKWFSLMYLYVVSELHEVVANAEENEAIKQFLI